MLVQILIGSVKPFQLILAQIGCRNDEPRFFVPLVFEGLPGGDEPQEGLLDHVLRLRLVFHKGIADTVDRINLPMIDFRDLFVRTQQRSHGHHLLSP